MCKSKRGYTLVELLIIFFILVLFSAFAAPFFANSVDKARTKAMLRTLVTDLRYGQQMAMSEGDLYIFVFNKNNDSYTLKIPAYPQTKIIKQVELSDCIDIIGTTFPDDQFYFSILGAPSRGGTINFQDCKGHFYKITILPATGRVKLYE